MLLFGTISKEGTVTPMDTGGKSMLTGNEPSGNSGRNRIEFAPCLAMMLPNCCGVKCLYFSGIEWMALAASLLVQ